MTIAQKSWPFAFNVAIMDACQYIMDKTVKMSMCLATTNIENAFNCRPVQTKFSVIHLKCRPSERPLYFSFNFK